MTLVTKLFHKNDLTTVIDSGDEGTDLKITGLAAGTVVADGDYVEINTDPDGNEKDSAPIDVPGFTVLKKEAPAPANITSTPTADGAVITSE